MTTGLEMARMLEDIARKCRKHGSNNVSLYVLDGELAINVWTDKAAKRKNDLSQKRLATGYTYLFKLKRA